MDTTLVGAGLACIIAAIIGGGLKAFGIEFPALRSVRRQGLLGVTGLVLAISGIVAQQWPTLRKIYAGQLVGSWHGAVSGGSSQFGGPYAGADYCFYNARMLADTLALTIDRANHVTQAEASGQFVESAAASCADTTIRKSVIPPSQHHFTYQSDGISNDTLTVILAGSGDNRPVTNASFVGALGTGRTLSGRLTIGRVDASPPFNWSIQTWIILTRVRTPHD